MLLDLRTILLTPGAEAPFSTTLDLQDMAFGSCKPVSEPVRAEGAVRNTAGVLTMTGSVTTTLHGVCDRCTAEFVRDVEYPIDAVIVPKEEADESENPWVFELVDEDRADLDDIITTTFVLNMPSQLLCSPDCKGICFRCGRNLNLGPCDCKPEKDPRFAALQQLLDKK